jgi:hypothetical protein
MSLNTLATDNSLLAVIIRLAANIVVLYILVGVIYYKYSRKEEYLFSFFLMGIIIFLICSLLQTVNIQLGMALGLFAIFAILRFRTVNYTVKDMTYVFTVIGISVINSQANIPPPLLGAIVINSIILLSAYFLEIFLHKKALTSLFLIYKNVDLLFPELRQELLKDLSAQTGQNIEKVIVHKIDLGKKSAEIEVFYKDKDIDQQKVIKTL